MSFTAHPDAAAQQGATILTNRYANKGTAFTLEERQQLQIRARLPPRVETIEEQIARCTAQLRSMDKPINKYQYLATLHTTNTTLYYALILSLLEETLPIIYTPTVGEACLNFGSIFFRERGLYFHKQYKGQFRELIAESCYKEVNVIVITDGSRILGLGDLGANGMGISIGKCSLYVVGGGVSPKTIVPVLLDAGTNNEGLRSNPHYLGTREPRLPDDEFYELLDEFMEAVKQEWPDAVVQFEDFSNNHCFDMLERYQSKYRCFNDDIQGTGAVVSAGYLNAVRATGKLPKEHRVLVFGAGSAAVGVALSIADLAVKLYPDACTHDDMLHTFYLVDTKGLVTNKRGDVLAHHKLKLARTDVPEADNAHLKNLWDVFQYVKPTALLGLGGVGPTFTKEMIEFMCTYCERPIVFPLSNPSSKAEIIPADAYQWSNGRAIVASGSPFPETSVGGKLCRPSQGNNLYIFPGLGLGCSLALPTYIPQSLVVCAAKRLTEMVGSTLLEQQQLLYPPIDEIRNVSKAIAVAVILEAQKLGIATAKLPTNAPELTKIVEAAMYVPKYPESSYYMTAKKKTAAVRRIPDATEPSEKPKKKTTRN